MRGNPPRPPCRGKRAVAQKVQPKNTTQKDLYLAPARPGSSDSSCGLNFALMPGEGRGEDPSLPALPGGFWPPWAGQQFCSCTWLSQPSPISVPDQKHKSRMGVVLRHLEIPGPGFGLLSPLPVSLFGGGALWPGCIWLHRSFRRWPSAPTPQSVEKRRGSSQLSSASSQRPLLAQPCLLTSQVNAHP